MWRVVIESGSKKGRSFKLKGNGSLSVGRSRRNGITLDDQLVSRLHCRLVIEGELLVLQDCGSHNGTQINHQNINKASLKSGDLITIGETEISVYKSEKEDDLIGKKIKGYKIIKRIGRGGGGTVYLAEQISMKRSVAIKVFPREQMSDKKQLDKFLKEARLAAGLNHPRLVGIHDIVEDDEICFFSMDYMSGGSLGERVMKEKILSVEEVVAYLIQACEGLTYLHEKSLVHRDIKPGNLMIDDEGLVRIGDFGTTTTRTTFHGRITGSPHFMSPEQARGQKIDARSDLYSLGCTAFRLLSGMPPFIGGNLEAILVAHINDPPPRFKNISNHIDSQTAKILDKLLNKDPDKRIQSAQELAEQLKKSLI